jgi:hypothetical protein
MKTPLIFSNDESCGGEPRERFPNGGKADVVGLRQVADMQLFPGLKTTRQNVRLQDCKNGGGKRARFDALHPLDAVRWLLHGERSMHGDFTRVNKIDLSAKKSILIDPGLWRG